MPGELRALVLGALDEAGGVDYLTEQARTNAPAFLALVGKCLPRDLDVSLSARVSLGEMVRQARERLDRARPPGLAE